MTLTRDFYCQKFGADFSLIVWIIGDDCESLFLQVDLFSCGIVLLELFTVFGTRSEGLEVIGRLREGRELPEDVAGKWPSLVSFFSF